MVHRITGHIIDTPGLDDEDLSIEKKTKMSWQHSQSSLMEMTTKAFSKEIWRHMIR